MIQQAYAQFQQQAGGAAPGGDGAPGGEDPAKQMTEQLESIVDSVVDSRVSPLMKKLEALDEKLEKLTMMLDAMQDTDDQRDKEAKDQAKQLRDEIAADLNPAPAPEVEKTAAVNVMDDLKPAGNRVPTPAVPNMFELVMGGKR
jgi:DNA repair exonuclease SbcCD ATPase subunit